MKNKDKNTVSNKHFILIATLLGIVLAIAVLCVTVYNKKTTSNAKLETEIEYIKRQYSNYI